MTFKLLALTTTNYLLGIRSCLRFGSGGSLLLILYSSLAFMLAILLCLASAWHSATTAHLDRHGFNRLTLATTNPVGLTSATADLVKAAFNDVPRLRVVPQYTTVVHMQDTNGQYVPFMASSMVAEDPILSEAPQLNHSRISDHASIAKSTADRVSGLVLSPNVLRRLGVHDPRQVPDFVNVRVTRAGVANDQRTWSLPIVGVVGELDKLGVRISTDTCQSIRRFQYYGSQSPATAEPIEVNSIHLQLPSNFPMEQAIERLRQFDPSIQISSPYFDHGKQRHLFSSALRFSGPAMALLIVANALVLTILACQKAISDSDQLALLRLSGANHRAILAWYAFPQATIGIIASAVGILVACFLFKYQLTPILEQAAQTQIYVRVPYCELFAGISAMALIVHGVPSLHQSRPQRWESALSK